MTVLSSAASRRRAHEVGHDHSGFREEKPAEGEVIAVGSGGRDASLASSSLSTSRSATTSCSASGPGTEVKIDGEDCIIMEESDVLGVIRNTASREKKAA